MTAFEIIEEGERLGADTRSGYYFAGLAADFYATHGPRLLAIVKAALALRNAMATDWPLSLRDEIAAFDAAVAPEAE